MAHTQPLKQMPKATFKCTESHQFLHRTPRVFMKHTKIIFCNNKIVQIEERTMATVGKGVLFSQNDHVPMLASVKIGESLMIREPQRPRGFVPSENAVRLINDIHRQLGLPQLSLFEVKSLFSLFVEVQNLWMRNLSGKKYSFEDTVSSINIDEEDLDFIGKYLFPTVKYMKRLTRANLYIPEFIGIKHYLELWLLSAVAAYKMWYELAEFYDLISEEIAEVCGRTVAEFNVMEKHFLRAIEYKLFINVPLTAQEGFLSHMFH